jgi:hypothetical protein
MQRYLKTRLLAVVLTLVSSAAAAHEEFRVIGTLTTHADTQIEVASRDGATRLIKVDKQTVITRDAKAVNAGELQAGITVVVDAYGDSLDDLLALEIRIVPPIEN